jgi:phosphatidate cytidylyltransferase
MTADEETKESEESKTQSDGNIVQTLMDVYVNYITKLWRQTDPEEREKVASQQALAAIKRVKNIMEGEEYVDMAHGVEGESLDDIDERISARDELKLACDKMLTCLEKIEMESPAFEEGITETAVAKAKEESKVDGKKPKKQSRSILFGLSMGLVVIGWVFSGNILFTAAFTLMTALGQLEYYRMVMKTGIYPARRISVIGACSMFLTALLAPNLHQICLPLFATYAMMWFLTMRRKVTTIPEIATTFTGMFYLGYIPSFWVRIRLIGSGLEPTRLAPLLGPILEAMGRKADSLPAILPKFVQLPITTGAIFIFWTWVSIAFSDVGAYFTGRKFGKTKLGKIAPAAGAASPNKTVEGYLGGSVVAAGFATAGAWVMRWPYWYITGPLHGFMLGFLGLVGDLTASMLKRDSGLKDFGDLIPEHGGIMDRVDSFVFTAPYSWLVIQFIIPALKARQRFAIP